MTRFFAGTAAAIALAAVGLTVWYTTVAVPSDPFAPCRQSSVSGGAGAIGGPFTLVDQTGAMVTDQTVIREPALIYFGYTFCPDVCPLDAARNAEAVDLLGEAGYSVTPVFISIDPARDTPAVLADFAANLHPRMIALTGTPEQVQAASMAYRTFYRKQDGDPDYYLIDHSTFTYLVLPKAGFVEFFRRDIAPDAMAQRVACFLDAA